MANSTWFKLTNDALGLSSLDKIQTEAAFNGTGTLKKYQAFAKQVVKLAHSMMSVRAHKHFAERIFAFNLFPGTRDYPLDINIGAENLKFESFFSISANQPQAAQNSPLYCMRYEDYLTRYPEGSVIPTGAPEAWTILPLSRTDPDPVHKIRIFPTPNDAYQIQYKAKLNATPLLTATDKVLWPPEYEHVLTLLAWDLIERDLGEGKEGMIAALFQKASNDVQLTAGMPLEARRYPRTMRLPSTAAGARRYNSPMSVDPVTGAIVD